MATQSTEIRRDLIEAIKSVQCRPREHVNFPNGDVDDLKTGLPRMDVQFLSAPTTGFFAGTTTLVSQLVQIDFYIARGDSLDEIEGYVDAFRSAFRMHTRLGEGRVNNPPSIGIQGLEGDVYRTSISFTLEYRVKF